METCNIKIKDKIYTVEIAETDLEKQKGLQGRTKLDDDKGMLFIMDDEEPSVFWMKDTPINLDIIFINEDEEVVKVSTGYADTEDPHTANNCMYVLELKQGSGVEKGDQVDLSELEDYYKDQEDEEDDENSDELKLLVIGPNGEIQMELNGGERIFSRKNTKTLIRLSKRAYRSKSDSDYKALGKKIFKYLETQNNKKEDFVELPSK